MTQSPQSFMTQSVLSQHINAVWQQHYHQILNKPVPPYILEVIAQISHNLAILANSDEPNIQAWKSISDTADLAISVLKLSAVSEPSVTTATNPLQEDLFDGITDPTT
jgi:hypothetical protein